ncbi:unnamed protein product [Prunus brigantina]
MIKPLPSHHACPYPPPSSSTARQSSPSLPKHPPLYCTSVQSIPRSHLSVGIECFP